MERGQETPRISWRMQNLCSVRFERKYKNQFSDIYNATAKRREYYNNNDIILFLI